jgi:hypothetical protein
MTTTATRTRSARVVQHGSHRARGVHGLCLLFAVTALLALGPPREANAQPYPGPGDWGDAPEGQVAYPSLGVPGLFPTCYGGPSGFIWHGDPGPGFPNLFLGFAVDSEPDGNGGLCPPPPYEMDECWGPYDGDGGLAIPDPFTLDPGLMVVPCGQTPTQSLGATCEVLNLTVGGPLEINIVNDTPGPGYINVLFDWNQDGRWSGASQCATGLTPEHAIANLPVPPLYVGPLSGLNPGPIVVGPNPGYVWMRVTITPEFPPVPVPWDGTGLFDLGETEDYLIHIEPGSDVGELGDAPEGVLAYPSGIIGQFPTCRTITPAGYVFHSTPSTAWFGDAVDTEADGNAGICPPPGYDQDECDRSGGDAGLLLPTANTMNQSGTITVCPGAAIHPVWTACQTAVWGTNIDIQVRNQSADIRYVNLLVDWDGDGEWTTAQQICPGGNVAEEHVLVDFQVPSGVNAPLSTLSPPDFIVGSSEWVWCRFTISDQPVGAGWDGDGHFGDGETEDYLLQVDPATTAIESARRDVPGSAGSAIAIRDARPNPFNPRTRIELDVARTGHAIVAVYDGEGRQLRTLVDRELTAGLHRVTWDGRDDLGRASASGIYFIRAELDGSVNTHRVVLLK